MEIKEKKPAELRREFEIVLARADYERACEERFAEMQKTLKLDGFREGKVPLSHIKRLYKTQVQDETVEKLVREAGQKAIADNQLQPTVTPEIQAASNLAEALAGEGDLRFTMGIEVRPEVKLAPLAKMKFARPRAEPGEKEIQEALEQVRRARRVFTARPADAPAEKGDKLVIDFTGKIDGEDFPGSSAENAEIVLGEGGLLPDLEAALLGARAGEERAPTVAFPAQHPQKAIAGKSAQFTLKVKSVLVGSLPELNDAFAKEVGAENLAKLQDAVAGQLKAQAEAMARQHLKHDVLRQLDGAHEALPLPPRMLALEQEQMVDSYKQRLHQAGQSLEPADEKTLRENSREAARSRVRLALVISAIGADGKIEVTDAELQRELQLVAGQYPGREKEAMEQLKKSPQVAEQLRAQAFEDKVVDYVCTQATIEDVQRPFAELMRSPQGQE